MSALPYPAQDATALVREQVIRCCQDVEQAARSYREACRMHERTKYDPEVLDREKAAFELVQRQAALFARRMHALERTVSDALDGKPIITEWRPIETAPRDRAILGWAPMWRSPSAVMFHDNYDAFGDDCGMLFPTHWMPLPDPPKEGPHA